MGLQDREYYRDDQPRGFLLRAPQTAVITLILINVALWIVDAFSPNHIVYQWGAMKVQTLVDPYQWYRTVTYGFVHSWSDPWHIIGNMFVLFFFGRDVEAVYGKKTFFAFYFSTLIISAISWALFEYFVLNDANKVCIGASGAVSGVFMLFLMHFPKRTVLLFLVIPVPAWLLGVLWFLGDFFGVRNPESNVAHSAHLAGFACGYLFYVSGWSLESMVPCKFSLPRFKRRPKLRVHDPNRGERKLDTEADRVLAKLHNEGADSLTPHEQKVLEDYSRRMQQKLRQCVAHMSCVRGAIAGLGA